MLGIIKVNQIELRPDEKQDEVTKLSGDDVRF